MRWTRPIDEGISRQNSNPHPAELQLHIEYNPRQPLRVPKVNPISSLKIRRGTPDTKESPPISNWIEIIKPKTPIRKFWNLWPNELISKELPTRSKTHPRTQKWASRIRGVDKWLHQREDIITVDPIDKRSSSKKFQKTSWKSQLNE